MQLENSASWTRVIQRPEKRGPFETQWPRWLKETESAKNKKVSPFSSGYMDASTVAAFQPKERCICCQRVSRDHEQTFAFTSFPTAILGLCLCCLSLFRGCTQRWRRQCARARGKNTEIESLPGRKTFPLYPRPAPFFPFLFLLSFLVARDRGAGKLIPGLKKTGLRTWSGSV